MSKYQENIIYQETVFLNMQNFVLETDWIMSVMYPREGSKRLEPHPLSPFFKYIKKLQEKLKNDAEKQNGFGSLNNPEFVPEFRIFNLGRIETQWFWCTYTEPSLTIEMLYFHIQ